MRVRWVTWMTLKWLEAEVPPLQLQLNANAPALRNHRIRPAAWACAAVSSLTPRVI